MLFGSSLSPIADILWTKCKSSYLNQICKIDTRYFGSGVEGILVDFKDTTRQLNMYLSYIHYQYRYQFETHYRCGKKRNRQIPYRIWILPLSSLNRSHSFTLFNFYFHFNCLKSWNLRLKVNKFFNPYSVTN